MAKGNNERRKKSRLRNRKITGRKFAGNQYTKKKLETAEIVADSLSVAQAPMDTEGEFSAPFDNTDIDFESSVHVPVNVVVGGADINTSSASAKKIKLDNNGEESAMHGSHNVILDTDILSEIVDLIGVCPACKGKVKISNDIKGKYGLSSKLDIICFDKNCNWNESFYSSKEIPSVNRGRKRFDINVRTVIAFREVGKGYAAIETVFNFMNISPMNYNAYRKIETGMYENYKREALKNMRTATDEIRKGILQENYDESTIVDIDASFDGTWQKRGYASLNGITLGIARENGKCFDYRIMSKSCKRCQFLEKRKGTPEHDRFFVDHDCPVNYSGSAPAMEANGVLDIFKSSISSHKVRIVNYIGDGDSKSYNTVIESDPYPGTTVKKLECIGHVQKRCGTRLRKLKKTCKDKVTDSAGKQSLLVKPLTEKMINKLQNNYGVAIRQNCESGDVNVMRKAVGAVLYHHCESKSGTPESQHMFCPVGAESWCKYQLDKFNGTDTYKHKKGLPPELRDKLQPIFQDLSSENLLQKCMHGTTQNVNEAINNIIWNKCPKNVYVERFTLEIGVCSAILNYNSGSSAISGVLRSAGCPVGFFTRKFCEKKDARRIRIMDIKTHAETKHQRKKLRHIRKGFIDSNLEKEGHTYGSGDF